MRTAQSNPAKKIENTLATAIAGRLWPIHGAAKSVRKSSSVQRFGGEFPSFRCAGHGEPREIPQFHQLGGLRIALLKLSQGFVQCQKVVAGDGRIDVNLIQFDPLLPLPNAKFSSACTFNENASHGFGSRPKEMPPAVPVLGLLHVDEPEVRVVNQRRGLKSLARLLIRQFRGGQFAQLVVDQRQQLFSCIGSPSSIWQSICVTSVIGNFGKTGMTEIIRLPQPRFLPPKGQIKATMMLSEVLSSSWLAARSRSTVAMHCLDLFNVLHEDGRGPQEIVEFTAHCCPDGGRVTALIRFARP